MFSREEASALRQAFWTTFGQYMAPLPSAEGEKVSWINYKTGEKHFYFKMGTGNKNATISIELSHPDEGIRQLYFEQLQQLKGLLNQCLGEQWLWEANATDENKKSISRVYKTLESVTVLKREDWPALISFFKPRIIALDVFWSQARYAFEALR